jgi:CheY-like chemotaxis protein
VIHDLVTDGHLRLLSPASAFGLIGGEGGEPAAVLTSTEEDGEAANQGPLGQNPFRFRKAILEHRRRIGTPAQAYNGYQDTKPPSTDPPELVLLEPPISVVGGANTQAGILRATSKETVGAAHRTRPGTDSGDRRAVVCEGDPATRHLITQVLEDCDVVVTTETDTASTMFDVVDRAQPEIVVLDPTLGGSPDTVLVYELCHRAPRSVVIVYSKSSAWRAKWLGAGATAFVLHPRVDQLADRVRQLAPRP